MEKSFEGNDQKTESPKNNCKRSFKDLSSNNENSEASKKSDSESEFDDGLDENFLGDEEDKARLEKMTEREREQELFNRFERREAMKIKFKLEQKVKLPNLKSQKKQINKNSKDINHEIEFDEDKENLKNGSEKKREKEDLKLCKNGEDLETSLKHNQEQRKKQVDKDSVEKQFLKSDECFILKSNGNTKNISKKITKITISSNLNLKRKEEVKLKTENFSSKDNFDAVSKTDEIPEAKLLSGSSLPTRIKIDKDAVENFFLKSEECFVLESNGNTRRISKKITEETKSSNLNLNRKEEVKLKTENFSSEDNFDAVSKTDEIPETKLLSRPSLPTRIQIYKDVVEKQFLKSDECFALESNGNTKIISKKITEETKSSNLNLKRKEEVKLKSENISHKDNFDAVSKTDKIPETKLLSMLSLPTKIEIDKNAVEKPILKSDKCLALESNGNTKNISKKITKITGSSNLNLNRKEEVKLKTENFSSENNFGAVSKTDEIPETKLLSGSSLPTRIQIDKDAVEKQIVKSEECFILESNGNTRRISKKKTEETSSSNLNLKRNEEVKLKTENISYKDNFGAVSKTDEIPEKKLLSMPSLPTRIKIDKDAVEKQIGKYEECFILESNGNTIRISKKITEETSSSNLNLKRKEEVKLKTENISYKYNFGAVSKTDEIFETKLLSGSSLHTKVQIDKVAVENQIFKSDESFFLESNGNTRMISKKIAKKTRSSNLNLKRKEEVKLKTENISSEDNFGAVSKADEIPETKLLSMPSLSTRIQIDKVSVEKQILKSDECFALESNGNTKKKSKKITKKTSSSNLNLKRKEEVKLKTENISSKNNFGSVSKTDEIPEMKLLSMPFLPTNFIFTKEELEKIRLSRYRMERFVNLSVFSETVIGCFVRIAIGKIKEETIYKVAEIIGVEETTKNFNLENIKTNKCLKLRHGNLVRNFSLEFVSNSCFSDLEYQKWIELCESQSMLLPTLDHIMKKQKDIHKILYYQFSKEEAEQILEEKERTDKHVSYIIVKLLLSKERETSLQMNDHDAVKRINDEIAKLENKFEKLEKLKIKK